MSVFTACTNSTKEITAVPFDEHLSLTAEYPHNTSSFTQGLFFRNGIMYESAGLYGESAVYKNINLENGKAEKGYRFESDIFAEGSVVFKEKLFVLTWQENCVMIFNPDSLKLEATLPYPREGWGLTSDGNSLIASDGSSMIYFMDEKLNVTKTLPVTLNGRPVNNLNELEYIDGQIWANVWLTNEILIIDKNSGETVKVLDFTSLAAGKSDNHDNVLNGIALNPDNGKIYITGKRWDTLYEFDIK